VVVLLLFGMRAPGDGRFNDSAYVNGSPAKVFKTPLGSRDVRVRVCSCLWSHPFLSFSSSDLQVYRRRHLTAPAARMADEMEEDELLAMLSDDPSAEVTNQSAVGVSLSQGEKEALRKHSQGAAGSQPELDDDELAWLMGDTPVDDAADAPQPMNTVPLPVAMGGAQPPRHGNGSPQAADADWDGYGRRCEHVGPQRAGGAASEAGVGARGAASQQARARRSGGRPQRDRTRRRACVHQAGCATTAALWLLPQRPQPRCYPV
jgi:hypothetical protein